ncbi:MAG: chitinase [Polyangiaceae bacterium]|nr:chitinase [Polyangiaceae bacterium]
MKKLLAFASLLCLAASPACTGEETSDDQVDSTSSGVPEGWVPYLNADGTQAVDSLGNLLYVKPDGTFGALPPSAVPGAVGVGTPPADGGTTPAPGGVDEGAAPVGGAPLAGAPIEGALEDVIDAEHWQGYNGAGTQDWALRDDGAGNIVLYNSAAADGDSGKSVSLSISPAGITGDMARSMGIRFDISGSIGNALFLPQVGGTIPLDQGGWCDSEVSVACWNAHEETVAVSEGSYTTVELFWDELAQTWGLEGDEEAGLKANQLVLFPEEVLILSWVIPKEVEGELFVDNIKLIPDDGSRTVSGIGELIDRATFNAITGNSTQYTYEGFVEAAGSFKAFGGDLDETWAKREIAMFLANAKHETGNFQYTEELAQYRGTYCDTTKPYGCPAGANQYYGRGSMQLSWNFNYKAAGDYLGIDLLNQPALAIQPANLWRTGLWFWMISADGAQAAPHSVYASGFGATINRINGAIECGASATPDAQGKVNQRRGYYRQILELMGVEAGATDTGC